MKNLSVSEKNDVTVKRFETPHPLQLPIRNGNMFKSTVVCTVSVCS